MEKLLKRIKNAKYFKTFEIPCSVFVAFSKTIFKNIKNLPGTGQI